VTDQHARHPSRHPAPKTSRVALAPVPAPAQPAQLLAPVRAAAFGPGGGDTPQLAHLAIGGHHAAGWHTDWYTSALREPIPRHRAAAEHGPGGRDHQCVDQSRPGFRRRRPVARRHQARTDDLPPVARAAGAGGVIRLRLTRPARGRYVLVWFTKLPADPAGTFQAGVHDIGCKATGDKGLRVAMLRTLRSGSEEIYAWARWADADQLRPRCLDSA
jgi:hypothetical protein